MSYQSYITLCLLAPVPDARQEQYPNHHKPTRQELPELHGVVARSIAATCKPELRATVMPSPCKNRGACHKDTPQ